MIWCRRDCRQYSGAAGAMEGTSVLQCCVYRHSGVQEGLHIMLPSQSRDVDPPRNVSVVTKTLPGSI